jgi:hypothetical protein
MHFSNLFARLPLTKSLRRRASQSKRRTQRRMFLEPLEARQLMAGDIDITGFTTDGNNLRVAYTVSGISSPFKIGIYTSQDGQTPDQLLQEVANVPAVSQTLNITPSFTDPRQDYFLLAKVDSAGGPKSNRSWTQRESGLGQTVLDEPEASRVR